MNGSTLPLRRGFTGSCRSKLCQCWHRAGAATPVIATRAAVFARRNDDDPRCYSRIRGDSDERFGHVAHRGPYAGFTQTSPRDCFGVGFHSRDGASGGSDSDSFGNGERAVGGQRGYSDCLRAAQREFAPDRALNGCSRAGPPDRVTIDRSTRNRSVANLAARRRPLLFSVSFPTIRPIWSAWSPGIGCACGPIRTLTATLSCFATPCESVRRRHLRADLTASFDSTAKGRRRQRRAVSADPVRPDRRFVDRCRDAFREPRRALWRITSCA